MLSSLVGQVWMLAPPLSNFKMVNVPFLLALGPPSRSHTQQFNSETEHVAQKLFSSKLQPNLTRRALRSLETSLCMAAEIHHALLPAQA